MESADDRRAVQTADDWSAHTSTVLARHSDRAGVYCRIDLLAPLTTNRAIASPARGGRLGGPESVSGFSVGLQINGHFLPGAVVRNGSRARTVQLDGLIEVSLRVRASP